MKSRLWAAQISQWAASYIQRHLRALPLLRRAAAQSGLISRAASASVRAAVTLYSFRRALERREYASAEWAPMEAGRTWELVVRVGVEEGWR